MDEDTRQVAEWASRVAWRSTGTVVVAGDLKCKYWEIFRQYNPMVKIIRFDPTGPAFDEEKKAEVLCCTTEHDLGVVVASNYKVPMRVEVIGSEEARASHGDALAGIVDSAVRTCVEAEHTTRVNAERWTRLGLEALCQMAGRTALNGMTQCLAGLPDFIQEVPEARQFLFDTVNYLREEFGIDAIGGMVDLVGFFNAPWPPDDAGSGLSD